MLKTIPLQRLLLYIILLGLLPIAVAIANFSSKKKDLEQVNQSLMLVQEMAFHKEQKQALNMTVRNHFRDADHFYIDKHVESLVFLEPEIESLQKIMNQNNFAEDETIKKRLEFLNTGNSLEFSEGVVQSSPLFQEVIETQVHNVEINAIDLQKILARVEGQGIEAFSPGPNRPQLMILDFKLDKKKVTDKNEVFNLNMKLLKREFL